MRKIVRKSKGGTTNIKSYQEGGYPDTGGSDPYNPLDNPPDFSPVEERSNKANRIAKKMATPGVKIKKFGRLLKRYNKATGQ